MEALNPISRMPVAQTTMVQASRTQSADIQIVTEEGDTVTLSASRTAELSFATYNSNGQTSAELRTGSEFSMSVEGDLSRRELKDIRRALRIIMKAAEDFAENNPEKAARRVSKLSRLDHLAAVNAEFQVRQELSVSTENSGS